MTRSIARSWWQLLQALGGLFKVTMRLFWRDPARMLYATWLHVLGDKDESARQIKIIEGQQK